MESILSFSLDENISIIKNILPIGKSFDIIAREIYLGDTRAYYIGINGMCDNEVMQQILSGMQNEKINNNLSEYLKNTVTYGQVSTSHYPEEIVKNILSGPAAILVDGADEAIIIDLRKYPVREVSEPENEKILKGSKDGFVESLLRNSNLIRRRVRNPRLTFEKITIGSDNKTDVAIAYIQGTASEKLVNSVTEAVKKVKADTLTLSSNSLKELIVKKRWYNPMPSFRITERPDVAGSYLTEGYVLIIADNSPLVIVAPGNVFQFAQSPEDYYRNPITGNTFRFLRSISILISVYLLPVYLLINAYMPDIALKLEAVSGQSGEASQFGIFTLICYVIFAEFALEMLEYSAAHIPENLVTPVSIVGGILIGEIAVNMKWFSEEVLFYSAITLLTTLIINSSEFADALRIYRMLIIIMTGAFSTAGLIIASILVILSVVTTPTVGNASYIWPLYPFDAKALYALLVRKTTRNARLHDGRSKTGL